ncbi:hypothetical protein J7T55_003567 [Diaporthe amygdali]|uniref:uncharacterized protein n=1 Tax=Phomopsis amygdali TaxID=1214568 RepID=UPI0022FF394A|nr:uncharacterized protein J7T55_003567 [Diaporthe amygdali]KAJ0117150.1 hypothetical protein J7T55_003567 [Diaporthe amygdali]
MNLFTLLITAFCTAVLAAPAPAQQRHAVEVQSVSAEPPTCVDGVPASTTPYDINYAAVKAPAAAHGFYDIEPAWDTAHAVGSAMNLYMAHGSDVNEYASFKCQYTCNGTPGCVSFFGRFVQVNSTDEHFECLGFNALLDDSSFTLSSRNMANGGFNKLCT